MISPEERADRVIRDCSYEKVNVLIARAIREAVLEEREACISIMKNYKTYSIGKEEITLWTSCIKEIRHRGQVKGD